MVKIDKNHLQTHAERVSQKLADVTRRAHDYKFIIADKDEKPLIQLPLLMALVLLILMPIVISIFLVTILFTGYHVFVHKRES